jgi:hypothetical protein
VCWGQPKHPRHDAWDRAMDERDARLKAEYEKTQVRAHSIRVPLGGPCVLGFDFLLSRTVESMH